MRDSNMYRLEVKTLPNTEEETRRVVYSENLGLIFGVLGFLRKTKSREKVKLFSDTF